MKKKIRKSAEVNRMKDPKRIMTVFFIGMAMGAGYEFLNTVIFHHGTSVIQMASTDEQHGTARS